jgi:hypothetical protein
MSVVNKTESQMLYLVLFLLLYHLRTDEFSAGEGAKWPYATTSFLVQSSYRQIVKDVARSYDDVEWTKALLDWVKTGKTLSKRNALPKLPQPIKENLKHVHWESENGLMILRIPKHLSRIIIASHCPVEKGDH